jgi:mRNA interferase MazF
VEIFIAGDIVVVPFPFSNLQNIKRRPALVLADCRDSDLILCQITSQNVKDNFAISIIPNDVRGKLPIASNIRPNKLFTIEKNIILYKVGTLTSSKLIDVLDKLSNLLGLK